MFFYRKLPPTNIPPNSENLRIWFDGKNIDGSNNSTLSGGDLVPTTINNLGTSGGAWSSSATNSYNRSTLYRANPPSIYLENNSSANYTRVCGTGLDATSCYTNSPSTTIAGGVNQAKACGFMVFTFDNLSTNPGNSDEEGFYLFYGDPTYVHSSALRYPLDKFNPANNGPLRFGVNGMSYNSITPKNYLQVNKRYCVSWIYNTSQVKTRVNGFETTFSENGTGNSWIWQTTIGAPFQNGRSFNGCVESFGVWEGNDIDLAAVETWVTNYYGALG